MTPDYWGFSPDIGSYVQRGDQVFTEHGEVYTTSDCFRVTVGPSVPGPDNYADWSDEKRSSVREVRKEQYLHSIAVRERHVEDRNRLVQEARELLSKDQFNAVVDWAQDEE